MSSYPSDTRDSPYILENIHRLARRKQKGLREVEISFIRTLQEILAGEVICLLDILIEEVYLRNLAYSFLLELDKGGEPAFWRRYDEMAKNYAYLAAWKPYVKGSPLPSQSSSDSTRRAKRKEQPGILVSQVTSQAVDWFWKSMVPLGKLTLLDGDPGKGKSLLLCDLAARLTRGRPMPDGTPGISGGVVIIAPEDELGDTIRPRLERAGADLSRVVCLNQVQEKDSDGNIVSERPFDLSQDLALLEAAIGRVEAKLVIMDPLAALIGKGDFLKGGDVRGLLAPLQRFMARLHVACVMVRHLMKKGSENALYRGSGSIAFMALARSGLLAVDDPQDQTRQVLLQCKNNLGPLGQSLVYRIRDDKEKGDERPYITWEGPSPLTAKDLGSSARTAAPSGAGRQAILDVLKEHGEAGLSAKQIAEMLPELDKNLIHVTLRRMVEKGLIDHPQKGVYIAFST